MTGMMSDKQTYTGLEIAIVGMACRFPGASNPEIFWNNLVNGIESVHQYSDNELIAYGMDPAFFNQPGYVKAGGRLENKESFDAAFFGYTPAEASLMNPVHRIFHECAWEAMEDAGYYPPAIKGLTGLYAGAGQDLNWQVYSMLSENGQNIDEFSLHLLNNKDYLASLMSYKLNLKGPAFVVNTACSTSLVALNLACKSLLLGEVKMAVTGAVSLNTQKTKGYLYQPGMINSKDGHCRAFDNEASGCVGSEGAGVVVLKRLADALRDRNNIHAVIRGSAVNNDGNRKVGYTAPSVEGQADCIRKALALSGTDPDTISYIETHGTGTQLGDPIEIEALNTAFKKRSTGNRCAIGAVKTNLGHLDTAAGMAGLIKTVLMLKNKIIPPTLHFRSPGLQIPFEKGPFFVNNVLTPWKKKDDMPLRAGVSSFGIGGTNAYVILEEAPATTHSAPIKNDGYLKMISLSAKTEDSLTRYKKLLSGYISNKQINLGDLSFTLQTTRGQFAYRDWLVYREKNELLNWLDRDIQAGNTTDRNAGSIPLVFMFTGQGSQYPGMTKGLYEHLPAFRSIVDEGLSLIEKYSGEDFRIVFSGDGEEGEKINETKYTQPLLFLAEYALARVLMTKGVTPQYMIGHSIGEYTAACISNVFSFEEAIRLVVKRGALVNSLQSGMMLSAALSEKDAETYLAAGISLAAVNAEEQVVFSGDTGKITGLEKRLSEQGVTCRKLKTSHAFHSSMIDPVLDEFRKELSAIRFNTPEIPFLSNVTGLIAEANEVTTAEYWIRQLRQAVNFHKGITTIIKNTNKEERPLFLEIGPGNVLSRLVMLQPGVDIKHAIGLIRSAQSQTEDIRYLLEGVCKLWSAGVKVDWSSFYESDQYNIITLPTYAFAQDRFPAEVNPYDWAGPGQQEHRTFAKLRKSDALFFPSWRSVVQPVQINNLKGKTLLVLSSSDTFSRQVRNVFKEARVVITGITESTQFKRTSEGNYAVNPSQREHFRSLATSLSNDGYFPDMILYAWMLAVNDQSDNFADGYAALDLACLVPAWLVSELSRFTNGVTPELVIFTNSLFRIYGNEIGNLSQSLTLGLVHTIPQESGFRCRLADVAYKGHEENDERAIAGAVTSQVTASRISAWREGKLWNMVYERNTREAKLTSKVIRSGGVYLITGGLGNVGFLLAKHIAGVTGAILVLTGRRTMGQIMEDTTACERWMQLEALTDSVYYFTTDITDLQVFSDTVGDIEREIGSINGFFHTAGITDRKHFELCSDLSRSNFIQITAPKILGVQVIHRVMGLRNTDFGLFISSISSALGGISYSAYGAGNAFMEQYIIACSANFPQWKSVALAELLLGREEVRKEGNGQLKPLLPADLVNLLLEAASYSDTPLILQSSIDLNERALLHPVGIRDVPDRPSNGYTRKTRPALTTEYTAPATATEEKLVRMLEEYLGIEKIGTEDSFFELGGDSLKAMTLLKRIRSEFEVNLKIEDFFDLQNVKRLAEEISERGWINGGADDEHVAVI
ncbi:MAG: SDR family NAD(P)-dependent oxidoreductase [Bacteroidetes bacterium]|nr:SDR family NAD(P)-dependent oxidoreductase [Bacteroidota bacterium]